MTHWWPRPTWPKLLTRGSNLLQPLQFVSMMDRQPDWMTDSDVNCALQSNRARGRTLTTVYISRTNTVSSCINKSRRFALIVSRSMVVDQCHSHNGWLALTRRNITSRQLSILTSSTKAMLLSWIIYYGRPLYSWADSLGLLTCSSLSTSFRHRTRVLYFWLTCFCDYHFIIPVPLIHNFLTLSLSA